MTRRFSKTHGWLALLVSAAIVVGFTWLDKPLAPWQWLSDVNSTLQDTLTSLRPSEPGSARNAAPANVEEMLSGRVLRVGDGDSLEVQVGGKEVRVRLHQIDTPELNQPWGREAKRALARKVEGRTVRLEPNTVDDYGRLVATVWLGEKDINRELVAQGHAWVFRRYLEDRTLLSVEASAKAAGLGLWSTENPIPPWEWRRRR